jgi:hypothetical protein
MPWIEPDPNQPYSGVPRPAICPGILVAEVEEDGSVSNVWPYGGSPKALSIWSFIKCILPLLGLVGWMLAPQTRIFGAVLAIVWVSVLAVGLEPDGNGRIRHKCTLSAWMDAVSSILLTAGILGIVLHYIPLH